MSSISFQKYSEICFLALLNQNSNYLPPISNEIVKVLFICIVSLSRGLAGRPGGAPAAVVPGKGVGLCPRG